MTQNTPKRERKKKTIIKQNKTSIGKTSLQWRLAGNHNYRRSTLVTRLSPQLRSGWLPPKPSGTHTDPTFKRFYQYWQVQVRPSSLEKSQTSHSRSILHSIQTAQPIGKPSLSRRLGRAKTAAPRQGRLAEPPCSPTGGLQNLRNTQPQEHPVSALPDWSQPPQPRRPGPHPLPSGGLPAPAAVRGSALPGRAQAEGACALAAGRLPARISRSYVRLAAGDGWPAGGGRASVVGREVRLAGRAAPVLCGILEVSSVSSRFPALLRPALIETVTHPLPPLSSLSASPFPPS